MILNRNKLYLILLIACLAGYIWLYFGFANDITKNNSVEVCAIKYVTNIPCPSCGSSRSVISLLKADFIGAFKFNPLGYLIAVIMLITPIWAVTDIMKKKQTLFDFYLKIEKYIRNPNIAIPLILLIITNWIWNIVKEL